MTQKEIQALTIMPTEKGFALCKESRTGKMLPVRYITETELTRMIALKYANHITEHNNNPLMLMPLNESNALAVTFVNTTTKE